MLVWEEELETGVELVDREHREIIDRINHSILQYELGRSEQDLPTTIEFLFEYVRIHFNDEERLQRNSDYPYYPQHRIAHVEFIGRVEELVSRMRGEDVSEEMIHDTNEMMIKWFLEHIVGMDKEFANYYRKYMEEKNNGLSADGAQ